MVRKQKQKRIKKIIKVQGEINTKFTIALLAVILGVIGVFVVLSKYQVISLPELPNELKKIRTAKENLGVKRFNSEREFKEYLEKAPSGYMGGGLGMLGRGDVMEAESLETGPAPSAAEKQAAPERVSETNVQVMGIDEPDIVKTSGKEIYFSSSRSEIMPLRDLEVESDVIPPIPPRRKTGVVKNIKAFPPTDLKVDAEIEKQGDLLLYKNTLIIFPKSNYYGGDNDNRIYGYDVTDPASPKEKWSIELKDNSRIEEARLYGDKVYVVAKNVINLNRPCPIEPFSVNGQPVTVKCADIYHPATNVPTDVTYTVMELDAAAGEVGKTVAFIGSSSESVIYMSPNAIYATYYYPGDLIKYVTNFFRETRGLVADWVVEKMEKLRGYDISDNAKMTEFYGIMDRYKSSLDKDERMKMENEMENKMREYSKTHIRELENTGIVKIDVDKLEILAAGNVNGKPLNQFSLDEYGDHLRVATTVGGGWRGFGIGGSETSANDIYILDKNLKEIGSVKDLGLEERIYSVRFIGDKGYVVTFKQIDPFFVLDLSDPKKPELKGELKIPGYSSYLHPLDKDKILGIGKEDNKVKVTLFDVSSPKNPKEMNTYNLDEHWSEIASTHHAFLLDKKHQVFFLPGSKGGYVFSYAGDELGLAKTVSGIKARRAIYINDYLYIIGDDEIVVLDESDWERVKELEF